MFQRLTRHIVLLVIAFPAIVFGRVTLTTIDGAVIKGEIKGSQLEFQTETGGKFSIFKDAAEILKMSPSGTATVILSDGSTVTGELQGEVIIQNGLVRRSYRSSDISEINFMPFELITGANAPYEICPLRVEIPAGTLFSKKRKLSTGLPRLARCRGTFVALLDMRRKESGETTVVSIRSAVALAAGADKKITLLFSLMQGHARLAMGKAIHKGGDEGEHNKMPMTDISFATKEMDPEGPEPTLRFELLTQDRR